jgi:hypothetical protein
MRYKALLELGYKEVPENWIRSAGSLSDDEKRRFIITDNVGFGEWDYDALANEWAEAYPEAAAARKAAASAEAAARQRRIRSSDGYKAALEGRD